MEIRYTLTIPEFKEGYGMMLETGELSAPDQLLVTSLGWDL